jgi:hypothetical protein
MKHKEGRLSKEDVLHFINKINMKKRSGIYSVAYKIILLAVCLLLVFFYTRSKAATKKFTLRENIMADNTFILTTK